MGSGRGGRCLSPGAGAKAGPDVASLGVTLELLLPDGSSRVILFPTTLAMKTLPDHLRKGMKLVIVGCNPTESSVRTGHYYSGRGNPFWPVLYETGVIPEPLEYRDDKRIIEF